MRRALGGCMRIVMVAEVGVFREGGKDQPRQPTALSSNEPAVGMRSPETKVDGGY